MANQIWVQFMRLPLRMKIVSGLIALLVVSRIFGIGHSSAEHESDDDGYYYSSSSSYQPTPSPTSSWYSNPAPTYQPPAYVPPVTYTPPSTSNSWNTTGGAAQQWEQRTGYR